MISSFQQYASIVWLPTTPNTSYKRINYRSSLSSEKVSDILLFLVVLKWTMPKTLLIVTKPSIHIRDIIPDTSTVLVFHQTPRSGSVVPVVLVK